MSELRVPTQAIAVEIVCADGRRFTGRVFLPVSSSRHSGPMRVEEWLNEGSAFFPFLSDDAERPVLMNKRELLTFTVGAEADESRDEAEFELTRRRVAVECEKDRIEGALVIDMPSHLSRVLDYLNRPEPFLTVRVGDRHHLVQKERITRVLEIREE